MSIEVKVEPIDRDIALLISDNLSPQAASVMIADYARRQLAEGEATNEAALGEKPTHQTFVDGSQGASEDNVRPDGTILYEFDVVAELFEWIDEQLIQHSPVKSGRYERSHTFYADGEIADPAHPPPGAKEYVFLPTVPYARKIEGASGRKPESAKAPDGVYQAVAVLAQGRFGNQAKISFTFRAPLSGDIVEWAKTTTGAGFKTDAAKRRLHRTTRHAA